MEIVTIYILITIYNARNVRYVVIKDARRLENDLGERERERFSVGRVFVWQIKSRVRYVREKKT